MKKIFFTFTLLALSLYLKGQTNFTIFLDAPSLKNDTIFIGYPMSRFNLETLYDFGLKNSENGMTLGNPNGLMLVVKEKNKIEGNITFPQPIFFMSMKGGSKPLFIDRGTFNIVLNSDMSLKTESRSAANLEYDKFSKTIAKYNSNLQVFGDNEESKIIEKQKFIKNYINKNPNSIVAFWEIVNDLNFYGLSDIYLENLKLFSPKIKNSEPYKKLIKILKLEKETSFPEISFDKENHLGKADFGSYKITFIEYWSTTCKPCIENMPELLKMYNLYKDRGVNFIFVTDEKDAGRIEKAKKILLDNQLSWKNYFDINSVFPKKLNAAGYPLQLLVNNEGKIIARKAGELEKMKEEIEKILKLE